MVCVRGLGYVPGDCDFVLGLVPDDEHALVGVLLAGVLFASGGLAPRRGHLGAPQQLDGGVDREVVLGLGALAVDGVDVVREPPEVHEYRRPRLPYLVAVPEER